MNAKERERLRALVKQWRDYANYTRASSKLPVSQLDHVLLREREGKAAGYTSAADELERVLNKP